MRTTTPQKIADLQRRPKHIRNICILAHVDHGKTSLADTLVASNGIISQRMAGKLRYLDSREDEQLRGITMKSSAISLHYTNHGDDYLINLIDSPGHIDFSSEVSTAVRLCDGAVIVIDVVEGVSPQTHAVLRQAWLEDIQPVLVLNKLDRLITEWKMTPLEAHIHLRHILEQVNAITAELYTSEVLGKTSTKSPDKPNDNINGSEQVFDWSAGLEETDDSDLYFSPDRGNVVFASALDGWGFGIACFAEMFAAKLGLNAAVLRKTLWGDFYLEAKTKRIKKGAQAKAKKPLFVQVVLENLWAVYDALVIRRDKDRIEKIVKSLNLKILPRDARHNDPRVQLQAICSQWLPLSEAVLTMVVELLPCPLQMSAERVEKLLCSRARRFDSLPPQTQQLKHDFLTCSSGDEAPVLVFVSKMFAIDKKALPRNRQRPLTQQDLAERREQARQRHAEKMADMNGKLAPEASSSFTNGTMKLTEIIPAEGATPSAANTADDVDQVFIAFARVFSGTVRKGQQLYVLGPKHDPAKALEDPEVADIDPDLTVSDLSGGRHVTSFKVNDLYLFMGRELEYMEEVPAGNVFGIGGLEDHVLKSATVASTVACPAFTDMYFEASPIVRVAVEPKHPAELRKLIRGMKLLNQADPSVQVLVQESGEHVLIAAGEIHLQKCIDDLRERYAKIDIHVSSPIVPFRETIIPPPKMDMVNEVIEEQYKSGKSKSKDVEKEEEDEEDEEDVLSDGVVQIRTPNRLGIIQVKAIPLPDDVTKLLEDNADLIKTLEQYSSAKLSQKSDLQKGFQMNVETRIALQDLKHKFTEAFTAAGEEWVGAVDQIWSFGPRRNGPNILLNRIEDYHRPSIWGAVEKDTSEEKKRLWEFDGSVISGFQLATLAGPLCEEPMTGVCFAVELWDMLDGSRNRTLSTASAASLPDDTEMPSEIENSQETGSSLNQVCNPPVSEHICDTDLNSCQVCNTSVTEKVGQLSVKFSEECDKSVRSSSALEQSSQKRPVGGPLSGQLMSCMKEACRRAFQSRSQRLMAAMYTCVIQATAEVLGKMYAVLGKRNGRVLGDSLREGSSVFEITAVLPVVESFGFAEEIRKRTSGLAFPQLQFSHWEVIDMDPFWVPTTEEEYLHFGEKADSENLARRYVNSVRKRKGLKVDEKIVEFAEKQRTLSKKV